MQACCSLGGRAERGQVARRGLLGGAPLLDAGDVVRGQQVHRVEAGPGEVAQLAHAGAVAVGEGQVGAALRGGDGVVGDGEVPHVQLVDRGVLRLGQRRLAQPVPALGLQGGPVQVDEHGARGVRGEAQRVRVGHHVGDHLVECRHVDGDLVGVAGVAPAAVAPRVPDAVAVAGHRDPALRGRARRVEQQGDVPRGRRPQRQRRPAVVPERSQARRSGAGVEVVEHAGDLHPGGVGQPPVRVVGGHRELAGEQPAQLAGRDVRQPQRLVGRRGAGTAGRGRRAARPGRG